MNWVPRAVLVLVFLVTRGVSAQPMTGSPHTSDGSMSTEAVQEVAVAAESQQPLPQPQPTPPPQPTPAPHVTPPFQPAPPEATHANQTPNVEGPSGAEAAGAQEPSPRPWVEFGGYLQ